MKNAMKKLMALVLVAMMLVSAVPFSAAATEGAGPQISVYLGDSVLESTTGTIGNTYTVSQFQNWSAVADRLGNVNSTVSVYSNGNLLNETLSTTSGQFTIPEGVTQINIIFTAATTVGDDNGVNDGNDGEDEQVATTANLAIYVNGSIKYTTEGTPNGSVSVANCLSYGGVDTSAYDVTDITVYDNEGNYQSPSVNGSFTLGAAGTQTNIEITISAKETEPEETTKPTETTAPADDEDEEDKINYAVAEIYVGNSDVPSYIIRRTYAFGIDYAVNVYDDIEEDYHFALDYFTYAGSSKQYTDDSKTVQVGQTVEIRVKKTESKLNDNKIYLQIYLNNDFDAPVKTLNVTNGIAEGGLSLYGDVEDLILDYFSAKTDSGIKLDGMYYSVGSWVAKFLEDKKVEKISEDDLIAMKEDGFVVFNIMVTNAKLKSSSTADSSNPKTGDTIMVPVAIMGVSACALAVAFYLNKKRAM